MFLNQLIIHYVIYACNNVCSPQLGNAVTTVDQLSISSVQVAVLHVLVVCNHAS